MKFTTFTTAFAACIFAFGAIAQPQQGGALAPEMFRYLPTSVISNRTTDASIRVANGKYVELLPQAFAGKTNIFVPGQLLALPTPDGGFDMYTVETNATMHDGLVERFPDIAVADIRSTSQRGKWGKVSYTSKGFHAMVFEPGMSTIFMDPVYAGNSVLHVVYRKADFITDKEMDCKVTGDGGRVSQFGEAKSGQAYNSCEKRTYRLAVAATGEYTQYHGGTVADAMAAIVITINRVNGIYERDFGVTMTLVPNNNNVVYTDPITDPFNNGDAGLMIQENQINMNSVIGAPSYDIGHVFGTNSGGLAGLGVTCTNTSKARGVTGSNAPIGDPFDVDYVAHEIGHQFGSNHSFNNACGGNRNNSTAAEPGSGSTIMAYAGICGPNVQNNSDDHFHGISMTEIGIRITNDQCPVVTTVANSSPVIATLTEEVFVPVSTPFALSADVLDLEQDALTYTWEQMDIQISPQPPQAGSLTGPNFRSLSPSLSETRFMPNLSAVAFSTPTTWERLPSVERSMRFRLSVRDNNPIGGCTQYADLNVNVVDIDGPFHLTYPNAPAIVWQGLSYQTVTWDVAGTNEAPINSPSIDLYLSTTAIPDFATLIAEEVPNTGSYTLLVPNVGTSTARIMARSSEGTFFDLSKFNFTIQALDTGFAFTTSNLQQVGCQGQEVSFLITTEVVGSGLEAPIELGVQSLPDGITAAFSQPFLEEGEDVTLTISAESQFDPGIIEVIVTGTTGSFNNTLVLTATVLTTSPQAAEPLLPANGAVQVPVHAAVQWSPIAGLLETYGAQIATDAAFTQQVAVASGLQLPSFAAGDLLPETTYYWRTNTANACATSPYSGLYSFTTYACSASAVSGAGVPIGSLPGSTSQASVNYSGPGVIGDVSIGGIAGTHTDITQLFFRLQSPSGTVVDLGAIQCGVEVGLSANGTIQVQAPGAEPQNFASSGAANFGPSIGFGGIQATAVVAHDGSPGQASLELCNPPANSEVLNGRIAIVYRGNCQFVQKVLFAQEAGAVGVVVINNAGNDFIDMGGNSDEITIPSVMIGQSNGQALIATISALASDFNIGFSDFASPSLGSCLDVIETTDRPSQLLSSLSGETAEGTYTLLVSHLAGTASGTLEGWSLSVCVVDNPLSANESEPLKAVVYPNPTDGMLRVVWNNGQGLYHTLRINDLNGRLVFQKRLNGEQEVELNLGHLSNGVYVLNLEGLSGISTAKVILAR